MASNGFSAKVDLKTRGLWRWLARSIFRRPIVMFGQPIDFSRMLSDHPKPVSAPLPSTSGSSPASPPCDRLPPPRPRSLHKPAGRAGAGPEAADGDEVRESAEKLKR